MSLVSGVVALATRVAEEINTVRGETATGLAGKAASSHTHAEGDVTSLTTDLAGKAATVHTHAAADVNSGTLAIARVPTGTTSTTVPLGNDSRFSDTRTPTDSSVTNAKVSATAAIAESKLALASDAVAATASRRTLGTGAQQAAAGNDSRLSDTRTPTDATVTDAKVATGAAIAETKLALASDAVAATASRRTLGTGSTQAAPGNHTHAAATPSTQTGVTGAATVNCQTNSAHALTLSGAVTSLTVSGTPTDGQRLVIEVWTTTSQTFTHGLARMTSLDTVLTIAANKIGLLGLYYSTRASRWVLASFNQEA